MAEEHPDYETPLVTPTTHQVFIPFSPEVLRSMLGKTDDNIEPFSRGAMTGSIVHCETEERAKELVNRFHGGRDDYGDDD